MAASGRAALVQTPCSQPLLIGPPSEGPGIYRARTSRLLHAKALQLLGGREVQLEDLSWQQ